MKGEFVFERIIGHLDMDAFFAAIEERDHAWLRGLPIVVGADPKEGHGRGVVATANYPAREYGIHSAMPIGVAWRLSEAARKIGRPAAVFLRPNRLRYQEVSDRVLEIVRAKVRTIEPSGIDECYFDLTFTGSIDKAEALCRSIQEDMNVREGLTTSIGIGPNKMMAKIASDVRKPGGLTIIRAEEAEAFLGPLPVRKIPGIGPKTEAMLSRKGIHKIEGLRKLSKEELLGVIGRWGQELYEKVRGRDPSPIQEHVTPKSIGEQETFGEDTLDAGRIIDRMMQMCEEVHQRFRLEVFDAFRTVVITVRFADFETKTRSHTLGRSGWSAKTLKGESIRMLLPFLDRRENPRSKPIRMIGVRLERLSRSSG